MLPNMLTNISTPFYVYDEHVINFQLSKILATGIKTQDVHFSLMANNNVYLLSVMKKLGIGAFVSSLTELKVALSAGFQADKIIFCSSGLKSSEIEQVVELNPIIIAVSYNQLNKYLACKKLQQIALRISFDQEFYKARDIPDVQRQGLSESQFLDAIKLCSEKNIRISGIHSYIGTNISNVIFYKEGVLKLIQYASMISDIDFIDISGGFGLDFSQENPEFNIAEVVDFFKDELGKNKNISNSVQLKVEPGRFLIAPAAKLICSVVEVFEKDEKIFVGVDTNLSQFPRPYIYNAVHRVTLCNKNKDDVRQIMQNVYIVGNTAKSDDFLARDIDFPQVVEGDVLCLHHAGAYCFSMSSNFCGQLKPAEYFLTNDNECIKIRSEQTLEDFLQANYHE